MSKSKSREKETFDVFILVTGGIEEVYVSYVPTSDTYRVYKQIGRIKFWDWQLYEDVFSDYEKNRFFLRRVNENELKKLDKKYNILELLKN